MRRFLLILLPLLAVAGAASGPAARAAAAATATIAPADLEDPVALRASDGLVLRIPAPGAERGRRAWQERGSWRLHGPTTGEARALTVQPIRRRTATPDDLRIAAALARAGIHLWGTAAPPPARPV